MDLQKFFLRSKILEKIVKSYSSERLVVGLWDCIRIGPRLLPGTDTTFTCLPVTSQLPSGPWLLGPIPTVTVQLPIDDFITWVWRLKLAFWPTSVWYYTASGQKFPNDRSFMKQSRGILNMHRLAQNCYKVIDLWHTISKLSDLSNEVS